MRPYRTLALAALTTAALGVALPAAAETCGERNHNRRVVGTMIGGIGGALLGNSISRGGGGAVIGGLGGAVLGNQIARVHCNSYRTSYYRSSRYRYASAPRYAAAPRAVRYVYYDQYGNPVSAGPAPAYAAQPAVTAGYGQPIYSQTAYNTRYAGACRTETRAFYDDRGALIYRPTQVCDR